MQKLSLDALAREELQAARQASSGRSSRTVFGGHEHVLRQTVIALLAGRALGDHKNPGEATVHVLHGRVRLHSGSDTWEGRQGDLLLIPAAVHGLEATEDAVVLLTVGQTPLTCLSEAELGDRAERSWRLGVLGNSAPGDGPADPDNDWRLLGNVQHLPLERLTGEVDLATWLSGGASPSWVAASNTALVAASSAGRVRAGALVG